MRRAIMGVKSLCTKRGCKEKATQWVIVRIDGLDVDCAKCDLHGVK